MCYTDETKLDESLKGGFGAFNNAIIPSWPLVAGITLLPSRVEDRGSSGGYRMRPDFKAAMPRNVDHEFRSICHLAEKARKVPSPHCQVKDFQLPLSSSGVACFW